MQVNSPAPRLLAGRIFFALLYVAAGEGIAQDMPDLNELPSQSCRATQLAGGDTIEMRASGEGMTAEIHYNNGESSRSVQGYYPLCWNNIRVETHIRVTTPGPEVLTVTPPDGYVAVPDEIEVPDGGTATVQIMQPMF